MPEPMNIRGNKNLRLAVIVILAVIVVYFLYSAT